MIKLGQKVRCKVTGLVGIATGRSEYLNGCVQICVTPRIKKAGEPTSGQYIDIEQLEVLPGGVKIERKPSGGPQANEPPTTYNG